MHAGVSRVGLRGSREKEITEIYKGDEASARARHRHQQLPHLSVFFMSLHLASLYLFNATDPSEASSMIAPVPLR